MLEPDDFLGCPVLDHAGAPLGRITALDGHRARLTTQREIELADATYDSGQRCFRLPPQAAR